MSCPSCGRANRAGARFCGGCGRSLAPRCPACGIESEPGAQFCDACGASYVSQPADEAGARKVVTIVFADLAGSTALHERLDAEATRLFMDRYYRAMRGAVEDHGGTVTQLLGDGVKAVFGAPRVAEDDALRAVRAAVGMQRAFRELASEQSGVVGELGLRIAVNTGEVVAKDETEIIGDPVNVAARLQQEAHDGDVLIGESTQRLVSGLVTLVPFGTFTLKGRAEPVSAYRVVSLERPAGAPAIAFVGREDELRRLMAVYDAAVATPGARLAVILGSPGLGKSRLIAELGRRVEDRAMVLFARCDATGGATFAPIAEALRELLGAEVGAERDAVHAAIDAAAPGDAAERARIADGVAALLSGVPESPEETFFVVRRLLAALAAVRPVVLAIDDLQWAEPLLLDLTEHLVQWSPDAPLLILAAARPELREARSSLATPGGLVADVVTLAGLDAGAATRLAANVIGADELPAAIAGRVLATSEGNPLFVGELVRMLVHDGALRREGDRWTAGVELSALEMPPTIHALLAARIERLRPEERTLLERAAVIGRHFSRTAVAQLLPPELRADLDARLESLRRSELIEPDTGWLLGEPVLRFHHVLIRDAAYRRLLKNTRAELHGRFADWLESRVGEAVEHDETIGWHLEQAHQHLRELGPIDERGRAVGDRAAGHLAAAGRRALARDDLPLAASLLGRALDRLDPADPARADLALDWCEALLTAGEVGPAAGAIDELSRFAGGSDRLRAWHTCFAGQLAALTDPQALRATADAVAAAAEALASAGDAAGEAKAHSVHALALVRLGKVGACEAALDRALAAARRARDRRRANAVLAGAPLAALWGPSPVTRASGRCLDVVRVLRITQGAPAVEAVALRCQAVLEALRGRTEAARRMIASSRRMVEELGITQQLLEADVFAGHIELLEGDAAAAERCLRAAYDGLRDRGLGIDAARAAALLGRALLAQGRAADAEALSHESQTLAGDDLKAAIAWRGVRAEALARRGEHAAGVDFARAAVDLAAATDALLDHADARLALAAALRAAGRGDEAAAEEARAIELWEAKGATLLAERARRDVGHVEQADRALDGRAGPTRPARRRVRANAATAIAARMVAAMAARDTEALPTLSDDFETVHHPTGTVYDREGFLATSRSFLRVQGGTYRVEPIATLGDSLALCRQSVSASGTGAGKFDVGAYEIEEIGLIETDARRRCRRREIFAADRLGDAVARLYDRYARLLPEGPERTRAAATARSVAAVLGPFDLDRYATGIAPSVEFVDQRIVGFPSGRGVEELLRSIGTLLETADDVATRVDDVIGLRSDALLMRWTTSGTDRVSRGAFEWQFLRLCVFGADGLLTRAEQFDTDRDDEALARFDELASEPAAARPDRRRVRPNAATANLARLDLAIAARDSDAFTTMLADDMQVVNHHLAGDVFDRQGALATWRSVLSAEAPTCRHEPLATLGDSLVLCRQSVSASGFVGRTVDVGAYEYELFALVEVDSHGRQRWAEFFAIDRLGDAVARLYERYARLLVEGPDRTRAAATASSIGTLLAPPDLDRWATAFAPAIEWVDHRTVGLGSVHGAEAVLRGIGALFQLLEGIATRVDDVLDLRADAIVLRWTNSGTDRAGGAFERNLCHLWIFGPDGLLARWEQSDAERVDEALALFDELTGTPAAPRAATAPSAAARSAPRVRSNTATGSLARLRDAVVARDDDAVATLAADDLEVLHHPTGTVFGREAGLARFRLLHQAEGLTLSYEPLATLGDSLVLFHDATSFSGFVENDLSFGASRSAAVVLFEVNRRGQSARVEVFRTDHLGDAVVRLYERYAELLPDGPDRARATATARSVATVLGPVDADRYATAIAPDIESVDRRTVGLPPTSGAEAYLRRVGTLLEISDDIAMRTDDVLGLRSDALLLRWTNLGTLRAGGGAYERHYLQLWVFGSDGLATRIEWFDADRDAEALARFDEFATARPEAVSRGAAKPMRRVGANVATESMARLAAATAAGDVDALSAALADRVEHIDHPLGAVYDREGELATFRAGLKARNLTFLHEPLAILGDSLGLSRRFSSASGGAGMTFDVGAWEREAFVLIEADEQARARRVEVFALDRLGDAVTRLYERYAELLPDGPERTRSAATARSVAALPLGGPFDLARYATAFVPAIEWVDHRTVGLGSVQGAEAVTRGIRALLELTTDYSTRVGDVLGLRPDALLVRSANFGTDRASGGAFERRLVMLWVFGADGLLTRFDQFDVGHEAEALARFDALVAEPPRARFGNAASRWVEAFQRHWGERDWDRVVALFAPTHRSDDRRSGMRLELEGSDFFASLRLIFTMPSSRWRSELLATRGERLALFRTLLETEGLDAGPFAFEFVEVIGLDPDGRRALHIIFDPVHLDAAYAELDSRFASGEGAPHAELLANLRAYTQAVGARDADTIRRILPEDLIWSSHRRLLRPEGPVGRDVYLASFSRLSEFGELLTRARVDHVPRLSATAGVLVITTHGTFGGGAFERSMVVVYTHDGGRPRSLEEFDLEQLDAAFARYEELTAGPTTSAPITNAATRSGERFEDALQARDWERATAIFAPGYRHIDRRGMVQLDLDRDQHFESLRRVFAMRSSRHERHVLATRGERLALVRMLWSGSDRAVGPSELEWLSVQEVDAAGDRLATVAFDADHLEAAHAELDARYAAGEAAAHARVAATMHAFRRAFAARDWDALAAQFAADLVVNDHRRLGWETLRGPAAYVEAMRSLVDLAPDTRLHLDHVRMSDRGLFWVARWLGTREGGPFEAPWISISEHDALGRVRRFDQYDLDQLDAALARYEELATAPPTPRIENAATRARDRIPDAWNARDWERFAALFPAGFRNIDRRRMVQLELDRDQYLASYRPMFEMVAWASSGELLATRGDRLALFRVHFEGADPPVGPSEFEFLSVFEADQRGDLVTIVMFDPDDLDAAYTELDDRYGAPVMRAFGRDFHARDWEAAAARLAPDLVVEDHRRLGWEALHGPAAYLGSLRALVELAPDARLRVDHVEESDRGALGIVTLLGTREGGAFEMTRVAVPEFDARRRIRRIDFYDLDQLDAARVRYEAIGASATRDPFAALARPNAATAAMDRVQADFEARDWAAMRSACAPDAKIEDRRRHALLSGDTEWWIADMQRIAEAVPDARYERQLVGSAGDRVSLDRILWRRGPCKGESEVGEFASEYLWLTEVDEAGRIVAGIAFDLDDWRAASREARARWLARDARAARVAEPHFEFLEALRSHDRARVSAAVAEGFVLNDRRRAGMGLVEGGDVYVETLPALWDLAPDIEYEAPFVLALERHGLVVAERGSGTLREGGGEFERPLVSVSTVAGGRLTRLELFDVDAADAALARLAELRPDPLRIPPNAATRTGDRWQQALEARDREVLEALAAPALVFDDRRRLIRITGDRDMLIASALLSGSVGRVSRTLLATVDDRMALEHTLWTSAAESRPFEVEMLSLFEVNSEGRLVAAIFFDPDDRRAASAELFERHARSDAAVSTPAAAFEFYRALNDHDLERCRALLPDDFVFHDHRRTGAGRLESADDYVASLPPLFERAPGWTIEALYYVAEEKHGTLVVARWFGTLAEGGEFETVVVRLVLYRGDRLGGIELFEPEDLDVARARLEELRPDPTRIPPNAASRARDRTHEAGRARDWAALRSMASDDFTFEDRGKRALVSGDVDLWVANQQQFLQSEPGVRLARELIATAGDRIALERVVWTGGPAGSPVEREHLRLTEIDADGRIRASIRFDLDDRAAAFAEAHNRFAAGEAAASGGQAPLVALILALARHDWETLRGCLAPDAVVHDHRMLSLGELGPEQWVESLRVRIDLAPDAETESFRILAWNRHGRVSVSRNFGNLRDGGSFENVFVVVALVEGDRIQRFEIFDVADADRALARFEDLCSDRP